MPFEIPEFIRKQLPTALKSRLIEAGGATIHVMEQGEGMPVLLLHGNPTWGFLYRRIAASLGHDALRLIIPDLVGLGFSSRPRSTAQHTLENHARWIREFIKTLGIESLILVAQDWGGPIGLLALSRLPEAVLRGLVLMNTVVGPPAPGFRPTAFHRFARIPIISTAAFRLFGFPVRYLHRAQGDPASIRGEVARAYRYPLRGISRNAAPLALARMVPDSLSHPSVEPLRECQAFTEGLSVPTALVWGERDPVLGRLLRRVSRSFPEAEVTTTPAGHFVQEEVPELVAEAVRRVWQEVRNGG